MDAYSTYLDEITNETSPNRVTAGVVCTVVDAKGKTLYQHAAGTLGIGDTRSVNADSLFWIASQTKLITAVACMQLVEKGVTNLDEDVSKILPELMALGVYEGLEDGKLVMVKRKRIITLRRLLTHSSGISYMISNPKLVEWKEATNFDSASVRGTFGEMLVPLVAQPGTQWMYSKGIDWAGELVTRGSKLSLEEYMKANIFDPLGMNSTTFHPGTRPDLLANRIGLTCNNEGKIEAGPSPYPDIAKYEGGGGGLYSTPNDYIKLQTALLTGGGGILKPASIDELFRPCLEEKPRAHFNNYVMTPDGLRVVAGLKEFSQPKEVALIIDHSVGGLINMTPVEGKRREGTMQWSGMANLHWWIDRNAGITGSFFGQLLPYAEKRIVTASARFEEAVYKAFVDGEEA